MGIHGPLVLAPMTRGQREEGDRIDHLSSCHWRVLYRTPQRSDARIVLPYINCPVPNIAVSCTPVLLYSFASGWPAMETPRRNNIIL